VSACTFPLKDRSLAEALPIIAAAGFKYIDLLGRLPHFSPNPAECDAQAVQALCQQHGIGIANLATYVGVGFASDDRTVQTQTLTETQHTLDLAANFGARSIRVFRPHSEIDDPARIDHITPWLKEAAAYAAEKGVYMGFENHGGPLCGNPDHCRTLCEKVGSPHFGVLYDPCNLMGAGTDYQAALKTMQDWIAHVHFKDGAITRDGAITNDGFQRTMLGEGQIDFGWIMHRLTEIGYNGSIALEYELPDPAPEIGLKQWYEAFARLA